MVKAGEREITRVGIVDDQEDARGAYKWTIEDADLEPVDEPGPLPSLWEFAAGVAGRADAAICDFKLTIRNYAAFTGAELVAHWYERKFPALLCTRYDEAAQEEIRAHRPRIPVVVAPDALDTEQLLRGIELCVAELDEGPGPERKPWRAQVHVLDGPDHDSGGFFFVELPGWHSPEVFRLRLQDLEAEVQERVAPAARLHAHVNLGAEDSHEVYFDAWEVD